MEPATQTPQRIPKLLILRGSPGSGKSTICRRQFPSWKIVSADDYFTDATGKYKFIPEKIQQAHDVCFELAVKFLTTGYNVVVDNTNKKLWEFRRYLAIPDIKYEVKVYRVMSQFTCTKPVPQHVINSFTFDYEPFHGQYAPDIPVDPEKQVKLDYKTNKLLMR